MTPRSLEHQCPGVKMETFNRAKGQTAAQSILVAGTHTDRLQTQLELEPNRIDSDSEMCRASKGNSLKCLLQLISLCSLPQPPPFWVHSSPDLHWAQLALLHATSSLRRRGEAPMAWGMKAYTEHSYWHTAPSFATFPPPTRGSFKVSNMGKSSLPALRGKDLTLCNASTTRTTS